MRETKVSSALLARASEVVTEAHVTAQYYHKEYFTTVGESSSGLPSKVAVKLQAAIPEHTVLSTSLLEKMTKHSAGLSTSSAAFSEKADENAADIAGAFEFAEHAPISFSEHIPNSIGPDVKLIF